MESKHLQTIAHALVLVAIMLGLIAAALWLRFDPGRPQNEARAQSRYITATADGPGIPDAGRQRQAMIEQLDAMNRRLADVERGLRDGSFAVQMLESKSGAAGARKNAKEE
ncbi:MAG: hypothetical protein FJ288_03595 [Planctomycetes bacterium]|nr:hypothetical protein [Planctomycetota bacterium]